MKTKAILPGIILLLFCHVSYSQVAVGAKAGLSLANVTYESRFGQNYKKRVTFHFGFMAEKAISPKAFLRSELYYSRAGSRVHHPATNTISGLDKNYLSLPLLFGYRALPRFAVYVGPEVSYTMGQGVGVKYMNDFILSANAGVMYNLTKVMSLDLRYTYGLTHIRKKEIFDERNNLRYSADRTEGSNRIAQLGVNYFFNRQ